MNNDAPFIERDNMERYFKKPTGVIVKVLPNHDIQSLKDRFIECDSNGSELKKVAKKTKKKESK